VEVQEVVAVQRRMLGWTAGGGLALLAALSLAQPGPGLEVAVGQAVCAERSPCRIVRTHEAGGTLLVVEAALHERPGEGWKDPDLEECAPWEVWVVGHDGQAVREAGRILELCNDGYGASGVGEDTLLVEPGVLVHSQYGGSAWRWLEESTYQLDPLMLVSTRSGSFWGPGASEETRTWDWRTRQGLVEWYQPVCPDLGEPGEWEDDDLLAYQPIPLVEVDPAYAASGWKDAAIGSCGLHVDATDASMSGFIVQGKPSVHADGSMSVLFVSQTTLLVEVRDDSLVLGKKGWMQGDHVQIWVGDDPDGDGKCIPGTDPPVQWAVGLSSGSVFPGQGKPPKSALAVERVEAADGAVRLRITFDTRPDLVTVLLSDSDDGIARERHIATSDLDKARAMSLGRVVPLPPGLGTCAVVDGKLDFVF
jgi:hypothetical protein